MGVKLEPFVQVVEVWLPRGRAASSLKLSSGAYGPYAGFAAASEKLTLAIGEGLPGEALATRRPVVWQTLDDARFIRHGLARDAGLDAGVAFPIFVGESIVAIVSLLCGSREHTGGCIEVWEPNDLRELAFADGYYGRLRAFADLSRLIRFQRGRGLPGIAWERGLPHLIDDLANSSSFVRAAAARTSGVRAGLAIPLYRGHDIAQVLVLLSAQDTPLARGFEVWTTEPSLHLVESFYTSDVTPQSKPSNSSQAPGEGLARQVAQQRIPVASSAPHTLLPTAGEASARPSFQLGLGIPVFEGERLRAIVNLLH